MSLNSLLEDSVWMYLVYKTLKICLNYISFGELLGIRGLKNEELEISKDCWKRFHNSKSPSATDIKHMCIAETPDGCYDAVVNAIMSEAEHTHITRKIHQVFSFLDRNMYYTGEAPKNSDEYITGVRKISISTLIKASLAYDNSKLSADSQISKYSTYEEAFMLLPPAFIEWKLYFLKGKNVRINKAMDNGLTLEKMSSGEKQMLESASYILYHIKNIESIRQDKNRMAYHHINIVLDEAELYYHPEYQRGLISTLIKMLGWSHINGTKIRSVNFLIVTHSPFVLSDISKDRILSLEDGMKIDWRGSSDTFAANINEILYNQFFLDDTMGEVARYNASTIVEAYEQKVSINTNAPDVIKRVNDNSEYYRQFVEQISESYLKRTLNIMLSVILDDNSYDKLAILKAQRDQLNEEIKRLENHNGE